MNANDFECVIYNDAFYCTGCCPVPISTQGVQPVFASDTVTAPLVCAECKHRHIYMRIEELGKERFRVIEQTSPSGKTLFRCRSCGRIDIAPSGRCISSDRCATWTRSRFVPDLLDQVHEAIAEMTAKERVAFLLGVTEFCCIHCGEPSIDRHGHPASCSCLKVQRVAE